MRIGPAKILILILIACTSVAYTRTIILPASLLFKYAEPMTANTSCSDGLSFRTPTVLPNLNQEMDVFFSWKEGSPNGEYCTGESAGSYQISNVCINQSRSDTSYCIHASGLSALSGVALDLLGQWNEVVCASMSSLIAPYPSTAIAATCSAKGSCSYTGNNSGILSLTARYAPSCTPV